MIGTGKIYFAKTEVKVFAIFSRSFFLSFEDAIKAESYFDYTSHPIECGEPDKHFDTCDFVREGQIRSGFQEHFYMEPSGALVIPKNESGEMEIFTTSQALTFCQVNVLSGDIMTEHAISPSIS